MKTDEAIAINKRFIEASENLVKEGKVKSLRALLQEIGMNTGHYTNCKNQPEKRSVPLWALHAMVTKFNVNAHWLLTGETFDK